MAKDNETIRKLKEKYNRTLLELKEKYPEMSFRPRSSSPDGTKANDINIEINGVIAATIFADDNYPCGRLMTRFLLPQEKAAAIQVEGRNPDPEPYSIYDKYRYRAKWKPTCWVRCFKSYDDFIYEIEKIICLALEKPIPNKSEKRKNMEQYITRRDDLVKWIKQEISSVPVHIAGEEDRVVIRFQDQLICGVLLEEDGYTIYHVSPEWADTTTYYCEESEDGTKQYFLESEDECIAECSRLVVFEAKRGVSSDVKRTGELIDIIGEELERVKQNYVGFRCERCTRRKREPEYYKLYNGGEWVGELWADKKGPDLWTNSTLNYDEDSIKILPKGITNKTPDVLYRKESSNLKGFHYTMLLSVYSRIYEVVERLIKTS